MRSTDTHWRSRLHARMAQMQPIHTVVRRRGSLGNRDSPVRLDGPVAYLSSEGSG